MRANMDRIFRLLGFVMALGMMAVIFWAQAPWFHDFAEWLFQSKILALKLTQGELVEHYRLAFYPVPNSLAIFILAGLCLFLDPLVAGKVYLILQILLWVWVLDRLVHRFVPAVSRGSIFLVTIAILAFSSFFWYGFISYQLALWLLVVYLLRYDRGMRPAENALFGILLFLSHAMIALVWGIIILADALRHARASPREGRTRSIELIRHSVPLALAVLLAVWYIVGRFSSPMADIQANAQMSGLLESIIYKIGYPLMLGGFRNILQNDGQAVFESWPVIYLIGAASNLALVLMLATWGLLVLWETSFGNAGNGATGKNGRIVAWSLVVLYLLLPYGFFGQINPAGRLLLPLLIILIALAPVSSFRFSRWAAIPALVGLLISVSGYGVLVHDLRGTDSANLNVTFLAPGQRAKSDSVLGFNAALYANTRFAYFNYRVLINHSRFDQIRSNRYVGLGFRTGPIIDYEPRSSQK